MLFLVGDHSPRLIQVVISIVFCRRCVIGLYFEYAIFIPDVVIDHVLVGLPECDIVFCHGYFIFSCRIENTRKSMPQINDKTGAHMPVNSDAIKSSMHRIRNIVAMLKFMIIYGVYARFYGLCVDV